jgi:two-component system sensor histidine kinase KdpD
VVSILFKKINTSLQYLIAVTLISFVAGICYLLPAYIGYKVVALVLLVTVSLIAMFFDIIPVLLSAALSAFVWDFFFIPPRFRFFVSNGEDLLLLLMYFVIAFVNAALTYKIRQMEKQASKREEKENAIKLYNTLLNSLSHELKTPIATIIGATDTLKESKLSAPHKDELIDEISIASLRLNKQVEDLLNMSRLESGFLQLKRDWCDMNELIYNAVNKTELKAGNRKFIIDIPENIPLFKLDFILMEQVINNLLDNAIRYTPARSVISISVNYYNLVKGHFDVTEQVSIPHRDSVLTKLVIIVSDNGPGFPEKEIDHVFDKFYRLNNAHTRGTGLGLSIVKGFVEAHEGTIELSNLISGGAKFKIEIPSEASYLNSLKNE